MKLHIKMAIKSVHQKIKARIRLLLLLFPSIEYLFLNNTFIKVINDFDVKLENSNLSYIFYCHRHTSDLLKLTHIYIQQRLSR